MTIYAFAPARLSERGQRRLRSGVTALVITLLSVGLIISWPTAYDRWVQIGILVTAVTLASTLFYRVSSIDRLFAFGLTASILATFGPFDNPVFAVTVWSIGVFIGNWIPLRSIRIASESTLCAWISATALVTVWQGADALVTPYSESTSGVLATLLAYHVPQIVASILAFYLTRSTVAILRALLFTRLPLAQILMRVSWPRIAVMLVSEWAVASTATALSIFLNRTIFQTDTPYGKTVLIVVIATTAFGLASRRQAATARERLNSLTKAALQLPWRSDVPVDEQALEFARQALPAYRIRIWKHERETTRDHIRSIAIEEDGQTHRLVALRYAGKPPFRIEDQHVLSAIAQVANETIRGRQEVNRLRRLANTDRLTGLLNYRAFQVALDELSGSHRADNLVALIFIDIDNFKAINDTYGHEVGNVVLQTVGDRIQSSIANPGIVARVGGDEFVVLLQHLESQREAEEVQQRLRDLVSRPIEVENTLISLRISQGIAFSTPGQQDLSPLVKLADRRMYESRGTKINPASAIEIAKPAAGSEPGLVLSLRDGILERRLQLVYQPIINLGTQQVVALEALMRYTDPVHGNMPVDFVLSEAQRLSLLPELSDQLLELCLDGVERVKQRHPDLQRIHLNVSLEQVMDEQFTRRTAELVHTHPGLELVLEVNERSLRETSPGTVARVTELMQRSPAKLAIDDIGQAYSGLASLRDFPFQIWKVDRGVVKNFRHERSAPLASALLRAANDLGVEMIFEGVETESQHDWLVDLGARFAQGFLYGRPVSIDELLLRFETAGAAARV